DRVPVNALDGFFLIEHTDEDHYAGAYQRNDRAVDLLRHDDCISDGKDAGRNPHRVQAEINMRCSVRGHADSPATGVCGEACISANDPLVKTQSRARTSQVTRCGFAISFGASRTSKGPGRRWPTFRATQGTGSTGPASATTNTNYRRPSRQ